MEPYARLRLAIVPALAMVVLGAAAAAGAHHAAVEPHPAPLAAPVADAPTADLVVDLDDGRVLVRRVVVEAGTTGLDVLEASGIDLVSAGGALCALGGVGCPAGDCFCACQATDDCRFWSYHHAEPGGGWRVAETGAALHVVAAGDVEGWVWSGDRSPVTTTAASRAVALGFDWLRTQERPDGSFAGDTGLTAEGVFAARAAGMDPADLRAGPAGAVAFLERTADAYSRVGVAQAGKLAAAAVAAGGDPRAFGGVDLVARARSQLDAAAGSYGTNTWSQSWAILGLAAAREPVSEHAAGFLAIMQHASGGWGQSFGAAPDADSTGLALQATIAAGEPVTATSVLAAIAYLDLTHQPDGGWGHGRSGASNVNSTAYVVQGLVAAGEDPRGPRWSPAEGKDPIAFLVASQRPEGRFAFDTSPADLVATLQTLPALAGLRFPIAGRGVAGRDAAGWILGQREDSGAFTGFNPGATIDAVLALAALGRDADPPASSGRRPSDFLAAEAAAYAARGPSAAGKLAVGVAALGLRPRRFGSVDLVAAIQATYHPTGTFAAGTTWDQSWAILGLAAAREPVPEAAVTTLVAAAAPDGGWGFAAREPASAADSTGLALQALAAAGVSPDEEAVRAGVGALRRLQNPDGGFPGYSGGTDATSTAMAIGGLVAVGQDVDGPGWARGTSDALARTTPMEALLALQRPEGGFPGFGGQNDTGATYAAALGLARRALPLRTWRLSIPFASTLRPSAVTLDAGG